MHQIFKKSFICFYSELIVSSICSWVKQNNKCFGTFLAFKSFLKRVLESSRSSMTHKDLEV